MVGWDDGQDAWDGGLDDVDIEGKLPLNEQMDTNGDGYG